MSCDSSLHSPIRYDQQRTQVITQQEANRLQYVCPQNEWMKIHLSHWTDDTKINSIQHLYSIDKCIIILNESVKHTNFHSIQIRQLSCILHRFTMNLFSSFFIRVYYKLLCFVSNTWLQNFPCLFGKEFISINRSNKSNFLTVMSALKINRSPQMITNSIHTMKSFKSRSINLVWRKIGTPTIVPLRCFELIRYNPERLRSSERGNCLMDVGVYKMKNS